MSYERPGSFDWYYSCLECKDIQKYRQRFSVCHKCGATENQKIVARPIYKHTIFGSWELAPILRWETKENNYSKILKSLEEHNDTVAG